MPRGNQGEIFTASSMLVLPAALPNLEFGGTLLKVPRNAALVAISDTHLHADDPEAALATVLRISQPTEQAKRF